ncbi:MAG: hypothetical protein MI725_08510 [Pirellulales bacterium]|nr:hypothetical protein [Pirellulales bacterium]
MNRLTIQFALCALWVLVGKQVHAQLDQPGTSTASWIGASETAAANQWFAYRKSINLAGDPNSAILDIATDSKYWLWINGEMVVFEGGLKRGPNPTDTYFDRVDVTPYLQQGDNTVALLQWYFGREGFSHHDSGSPGLVIDGQIDGQALVTDGSWRVARHGAYGTASGAVSALLPESSILFDQSQDLNDWQSLNYDDSSWSSPTVLGSPGDAPWNGLVERNIPQWKDYGFKKFINSSFISNGEQLTFELPYQAQFTPYFKISVPQGAAGETVTMFTETNGLSKTRAEYVTATGIHEYESLGWISGEELKIQFPEGVHVWEVGYRETGFDTEFIDRFVGDDPRINSLLDKGARTLYLNMRDNFFDTPDRERAAWWGDIVNELGHAFYTFDTDAHSLIRKSVLNLADWSKPDGTLYSPIPSVTTNRELPMQMLASVGHYGFANYYRHTGDVAAMTHVYPKVSDYVLNVWQMGNDGLLDTSRIVHGPNMWNWFDWGENIDREVIANSWYYLALKGQREQALATGNVGDITTIDQRMQSIANNFDSTFWDASTQSYFSSVHEGNGGVPDDRAATLAVLSGLAPSTRYDAIRKLLVKQEESSPFMEAYVPQALAEMGYAADGLMRLRRRYADQIDGSQSTLGEIFQAGLSVESNWTKNHAWNAPLTFFAEYVTGIKPISAGFNTYEVRPNFAGLNAASQHVETVKGALNVDMKRTDPVGPTAGYQLKLHSPVGSQANVSLPLDGISSFSQIQVNGQVVYDNGTPTNIPGFSFAGVSNGRLEFQVDPGDWDIDVVGQQAGYFTTRSWQSDDDLPLDSSKTYTHAIDFSPGGSLNQTLPGTTIIGGVPFTQESVGSSLTAGINQIGGHDNTSGAGWSISGIEIAYEGVGSRAPGSDGGLLSDALVAEGDNQVVQLIGLTPFTDYVFTWYSPLWTGTTDRVGILDGSDDGIGQGMTIAVVQDADAELLITQYRYNTGNSTTFEMHYESLTPGETLHHYAFTNELASDLLAAIPILGDANGDGIVDLADYQLINDNFFSTVTPGTLGDVNTDGLVNAEDFRLWQQEYSTPVVAVQQGQAQVPEPGTATLFCLWVTLSCFTRLGRLRRNA